MNAVLLILFTLGNLSWAHVKAFPTAEGFGAGSLGGRGGRVIEVQNLNDSGPGSLRACVTATGPRTCVFRVSGTIQLASNLVIREANSYLTIPGQTAPINSTNGGIQLRGGGIVVMDGGHDVIVRHLRIRPGAIPDPANPGQYLLRDTNAFVAWGNKGRRVYNVIVDHCSLEWSTDQNGPDAWGLVTDYTAQWNITARGTNIGNDKGSHNFGLIVGANPGITMSLHHSLFAHNNGRNPKISQSKIVDFRNNVVFNWAGNGGGASWGGWVYESGDPTYCPNGCGSSAFGNIVNNIYRPGPTQNPVHSAFVLSNLGDSSGKRVDGRLADRGGTKVFVAGNWSHRCPTGCSDEWQHGFVTFEPDSVQKTAPAAKARVLKPFPAPAIQTDPTNVAFDKVLNQAGPFWWQRDEVDKRIVDDVRAQRGHDRSALFAGGPWPDFATGAPRAPVDTDRDGMPDIWEKEHGLNPQDGADGAMISSSGYTHLENYLNELAREPMSTVPNKKPSSPVSFSVR